VAVVASSPAMRAGLRVVLDGRPDLVIAGDTAPDDPERTPVINAEIVVAYRTIPAWVATTATLLGVVVLSDDPETPSTLPSGTLAWALLPEDAAPAEIVAAVQSVAQGLIVVHPTFAAQMVAPAGTLLDAATPEPLDEPLTTREREVLEWLGQGLSNRQIAGRLDISEHTVKFHVSAIYAKLGVRSRAEAVRVAARRGLLIL
jgi:DNA-binding NarL/FixJ family response regulator